MYEEKNEKAPVRPRSLGYSKGLSTMNPQTQRNHIRKGRLEAAKNGQTLHRFFTPVAEGAVGDFSDFLADKRAFFIKALKDANVLLSNHETAFNVRGGKCLGYKSSDIF